LRWPLFMCRVKASRRPALKVIQEFGQFAPTCPASVGI
jgi:hypothetical protein